MGDLELTKKLTAFMTELDNAFDDKHGVGELTIENGNLRIYYGGYEIAKWDNGKLVLN